jgi:hypothetical protein
MVRLKLCVAGIGAGLVLILIGFFESNLFGADAQMFFSGPGREAAFCCLAAGTIVISAGVLSFAHVVTE